MFRAAHTGQYGEDAGAATHVEHFPSLHIVVEDALNHLRRGGMMACAKGHLRIDGDVVFRLRHILWNVPAMTQRSPTTSGWK